MMKILHAPNEIAGQLGILSIAQRELGHHSISLLFKTGPHNFKCDINLHFEQIQSR